MKTVLIPVIAASLACMLHAVEPEWSPEDRAWEAKQVELWKTKLREASGLPPSEKFEALALGLRNMGYRESVAGHSSAVDQIYEKMQQEAISIPGHATYYRDKLKAAQAAVREGKMTWGDWDTFRTDAFHTLQHMPSEETVEVLAGFLDDRFACADSDNPADYQIKGLDGYIREWDMSVRVPATHAMASLGIEDSPAATDSHIDGGGARRGWQQWWKEVKAGKRKYRFKGSDLWHPVNAPPGAEREVRRPDRHPGTPPAVGSPSHETVSADAGTEVSGPASTKWFTLAGIAAILASMAAYYLKRKGAR